MTTSRWSLINYFDVWGNEEDGYWVNNQCVEFDDLVITSDATKQDLLDYLYNIEFFSTNNMDDFEIDFQDDDWIEFFEARTMMPLCRLVREV